jgi:adenylosuccinate lyase
VIKEHAVDVALGLREGTSGNDLIDRLAQDPRLGFDRSDLEDIAGKPLTFIGAATAQVSEVVRRIEKIAADHPGAAAYAPAPIL